MDSKKTVTILVICSVLLLVLFTTSTSTLTGLFVFKGLDGTTTHVSTLYDSRGFFRSTPIPQGENPQATSEQPVLQRTTPEITIGEYPPQGFSRTKADTLHFTVHPGMTGVLQYYTLECSTLHSRTREYTTIKNGLLCPQPICNNDEDALIRVTFGWPPGRCRITVTTPQGSIIKSEEFIVR